MFKPSVFGRESAREVRSGLFEVVAEFVGEVLVGCSSIRKHPKTASALAPV